MSEPVGNGPRSVIPSNSKKAQAPPPLAQQQGPEPVKQIVTSGGAKLKKKSLLKRTSSRFISDDAGTIWEYLLDNVLIPGARDLARAIVVGGIDRTLYGGGPSRGGYHQGTGLGTRGGPGSVRAKYAGLTQNGSTLGGERQISAQARANFDFSEVVITDREEALSALNEMLSRLDRFKAVTVHDFYQITGIPRVYPEVGWGWYSLMGADIRQTPEGWLLDLPRPVPLRS